MVSSFVVLFSSLLGFLALAASHESGYYRMSASEALERARVHLDASRYFVETRHVSLRDPETGATVTEETRDYPWVVSDRRIGLSICYLELRCSNTSSVPPVPVSLERSEVGGQSVFKVVLRHPDPNVKQQVLIDAISFKVIEVHTVIEIEGSFADPITGRFTLRRIERIEASVHALSTEVPDPIPDSHLGAPVPSLR